MKFSRIKHCNVEWYIFCSAYLGHFSEIKRADLSVDKSAREDTTIELLLDMQCKFFFFFKKSQTARESCGSGGNTLLIFFFLNFLFPSFYM